MSINKIAKGKDLIVLLHGILRSRTDMLPLSLYLHKNGYETLNILYPSRAMSLEDLAEFVCKKIISSKNYDQNVRIHFVTHSMGGLVARTLIARGRPGNLGRVVMLGPPNTGSEMADYLLASPLLSKPYRAVFGPAGQQLGTRALHPLPPVDFPLGVIAGSRSMNPLALLALKNLKPHDGMVPVARTKITGMADHIVIPSTHTLMMFRPEVMRQTREFLENGKFRR